MKTILFIFIGLVSGLASADELTWSDLRPNVAPIEDPFLTLSDEQLFELGTLARLNTHKQLTSSQLAEQKEITQKLGAEGVDIEYLFSKRAEITEYRKRIATEPNLKLADKDYRIPGFITPIEFDDEVVTKFFLVPTSGACVHTPPPPANQIVLVDYPQGYPLTSLYTPVWVDGHLIVEKQSADVTYVDGATDIETVYAMTAKSIELYQN